MKITTLARMTTALTTLAVASNFGNVAIAQEDTEASTRDTIVVSARKKEQGIQDVPIAITAIGNQELGDAAFDNIIDVAAAAPGLFVEPINDRNARVATSPRFRGVTFDATSPLQRTATVFVDGVIVTGGIQSLGVQELERVEIIKGPQSALFGRNTFSGAINYVTKDPGDELKIDATWLGATRGEYQLAASVEGPIIGDVLTGRLNASYIQDGGHYTNSNGGIQELGEETTFSVSGALLYQPTDQLRVKLRGQYYRNNDGPAATTRVGGFTEHNFGGFPIVNGAADLSAPFSVPSSADLGAGLFTESAFRGTLRVPDASQIGLNTTRAEFDRSVDAAVAAGDPTFLGFDFDDLGGAGLIGDGLRFAVDAGYEFENGITFNFLAGYNEDEYLFYTDFDSTPTFGFNTTGAQEAEDISIEARFAGSIFNDRLDWTLGGSYVDVDIATAGGFWDGILGFWFPGLFEAPSITGAETIGVFGILDFAVTDQIKVIFEGRYQSDEISDESLPGVSPGTFEKFLPRVLVQFEPTDSTLLYANYSVGNLPGGFNPEVGELDSGQLAELLTQNPGVSTTFGEERLVNYELGWKQSALDGQLAFNLAAFYMRRTDQIFSGFQIVTDIANINGVRTVAFTDNGATTNIYGVEVDASWNVTENLSVQGSFAYIDASIDSFPVGAGAGDFTDVFGPGADPSGQTAARFPPYAGSFSATYERPLDRDFFGQGEASWYARGDMFYTGSFYDEITNIAETPEAVDVNFRVGIRTENVRYELFATNLLDEDAAVGANNIADTSAAVRFGSGFFDFNRESTHIALRDRRQIGGRIQLSF